MKTRMKSIVQVVLLSMAAMFIMMLLFSMPAHARQVPIELQGGTYNLDDENRLVNEVTGESHSVQSGSEVRFSGDTIINLNGNTLSCSTLRSDAEYGHPWYTYDLTIDGGDKGGYIEIGDVDLEEIAIAANNLTIRNLDECTVNNNVAEARTVDKRYAMFASEDFLIENIKELAVKAREGIVGYYGAQKLKKINTCGIETHGYGIGCNNTNDENIEIVDIEIMGMTTSDSWSSCIRTGTNAKTKIAGSTVLMSNDADPNEVGAFCAFGSYMGDVEVTDSVVGFANDKEGKPAFRIGGSLTLKNDSLVGFINMSEKGPAMLAGSIDLGDDHRVVEPEGAYIDTYTFEGKTYKTLVNEDGSPAAETYIGPSNVKATKLTATAPSKSFVGSVIPISGMLIDEDGEAIANAEVEIAIEVGQKKYIRAAYPDESGRWSYTFDEVEKSQAGTVKFSIQGWVDTRYHTNPVPLTLETEIVESGYVERIKGIELKEPPEGKNRKTEYLCGEEFDPEKAYMQAKVRVEYSDGTDILEAEEYRDIDPENVITQPAKAKAGDKKFTVTYMFEGASSSLDYPINVSHKWDAGKITKAATCTTDGVKTYTCSGCGESKEEAVKATGHKYGAWTKADGAQHQRVCQHDKTHIEKASHSWDAGKVTKAATCTTDGVKTHTCSGCGATKGEAIKKKGHKYSAWTKVDGAQHQRVCQHDKTHIEKTGHSWDAGKVTKAATCTTDGVKTYTCSGCGATKGEAIKAKGHSWDAGKVTRAATTSATGVKTFTCSSCHVAKTETIAKLPKKANSLKVKGKTAKVKYSKLRKKSQTLKVSKVIKFTKKGQGKKTYKLSSAKKGKKSYKKYFKINKSTGKLTIKKNKKMKKGTYTVKAKVKAAGTKNHKASSWKTVTIKIKLN